MPTEELLVSIVEYPTRFGPRAPDGTPTIAIAHRALAGEIVSPVERSCRPSSGSSGRQGLVEMHRGTIAVRSGGPGKGTEFIVTLPAATRAPRAASVAGAGSVRAAFDRAVLIIEDSVDAAETLADVLRLNGHVVHVARDATSGIAMALELKPDATTLNDSATAAVAASTTRLQAPFPVNQGAERRDACAFGSKEPEGAPALWT